MDNVCAQPRQYDACFSKLVRDGFVAGEHLIIKALVRHVSQIFRRNQLLGLGLEAIQRG